MLKSDFGIPRCRCGTVRRDAAASLTRDEDILLILEIWNRFQSLREPYRADVALIYGGSNPDISSLKNDEVVGMMEGRFRSLVAGSLDAISTCSGNYYLVAALPSPWTPSQTGMEL